MKEIRFPGLKELGVKISSNIWTRLLRNPLLGGEKNRTEEEPSLFRSQMEGRLALQRLTYIEETSKLPDFPSHLELYKQSGYSEDQAIEALTNMYIASGQGKLIQARNSQSIEENNIACEALGALQFSMIVKCLGVLYQFSAESCELGVHIVAARDSEGERALEQKTLSVFTQIEEITAGKVPSKIILVSAHLGETLQHRIFIAELKRRFHNSKVEIETIKKLKR